MPISPSELFALRAAHERGEVPAVGHHLAQTDGAGSTTNQTTTKQKESAR
jgi:hypothetical protein